MQEEVPAKVKMSFLKTLETIGSDILKGVETVAPIVGAFVPAAGPILYEVAQVIATLESQGKTLSPAQVSQLVQTLTAAQTVKQSTSAASPPAS